MTTDAKAAPQALNRQIALAIGALGVVYGDIGTSPLYALRECFHGENSIVVSRYNVLGTLSLIFWSLVLIISIKYITFVMRADNKGEGGILALLSLAFSERQRKKTRDRKASFIIAMGVFGAALLYGDGMITPSISVLSAIEGLKIATPFFQPYIVPITIVVLIGLFSFQKVGTGKVGKIFGPVTLLWFLSLSALGIHGIIKHPSIVLAVNPWYAADFLVRNGWLSFLVLGAVFLVVTGGEALYADMGHFGKRPIRMAWFTLVLPSLLLNYFGQGALLLANPEAAENPFYRLAPPWAIYPLVVLATFATVIASQALISGAFSLTMQAIQLGYSPRLQIDHTSSHAKGQIYMPHVNFVLMLACITLVIGFQSSSNLAAAYGIAVSLTMIITTVLFYFAAQRTLKWRQWQAALLCLVFLLVELAFFGANTLKISHGGWFPILVGTVIYLLMSTWKTGRRILAERLNAATLPFEQFLKDIGEHPPVRVPGTAIFMSGNPRGIPHALLHNLKHNKVLHERVVTLTVVTDEVSHVDPDDRLEVKALENNFYRMIAHYGFMESPDVAELLEASKNQGLEFRPQETTFFLGRETIIPTHAPGMAIWREKLFAIMARNSQRATAYFQLPANRVIELGMQIEI